MKFITLVKSWVRLHKSEFSPVICQDDSFIMFVHTLDDYGWNSYAFKTRVKFHRGRSFVDLLSHEMLSFSVFVCWTIADGTYVLINRG